MKAIIWGAGGTAKEFLMRKIMHYPYEIIGVIDSNKEIWGRNFNSYNISSPDILWQYEYEMIIVCSICYEEIVARLINEYHIPENKIISYQEIDKQICNRIVEKYKDRTEPDMVATINELKKGVSSILGAYNPSFTVFEDVFRDEENWPYIVFQGKKMYYPLNHTFIKKNGKDVVPDIFYEQKDNSPHMYLPKNYNMPNNAIIVDAGVCEGNFALRFVDIAKKIYLIEADCEWMEALKRTFAPYKEKIVFVNKFLSGRDNAKEITIDSLVEENLDFLKMDIEGAEVDSLLGARRVLTENNVQCAISSYHRQNDKEYIEFILQSYGYKTKPTDGYIFFAYDENMIDSMDLRKGVIHASKG